MIAMYSFLCSENRCVMNIFHNYMDFQLLLFLNKVSKGIQKAVKQTMLISIGSDSLYSRLVGLTLPRSPIATVNNFVSFQVGLLMSVSYRQNSLCIILLLKFPGCVKVGCRYPPPSECIAALKQSTMPCGVPVPMRCIYQQE